MYNRIIGKNREKVNRKGGYTMAKTELMELKYDAKKFKTPYLVKDSGTGLCYIDRKSVV